MRKMVFMGCTLPVWGWATLLAADILSTSLAVCGLIKLCS